MKRRTRDLVSTLAASTGVIILAFSSARADCSSDERSIQAEMQRINAQSSSLGMCGAARAMVDLYDRAAAFHRRCVPGPAGQSQASEYERAAGQARETASQACN